MAETAVQPLAGTNAAIEELEEEIRRENERRYAFYRMLGATDRVLWRLEELNRDGVKRLGQDAWQRLHDQMSELPTHCRERFPESEVVQQLLDGLFDVQNALFRHHDPEWMGDEDEVEALHV